MILSLIALFKKSCLPVISFRLMIKNDHLFSASRAFAMNSDLSKEFSEFGVSALLHTLLFSVVISVVISVHISNVNSDSPDGQF